MKKATLLIAGAAVSAAFALAGPMASAKDKKEKAAEREPSKEMQQLLEEYKVTDETARCLHTRRIYSSDVLDDWNIVFRMRGGDRYLNTLPHRCPQLGFEESFGYTLRGLSELCDLDMITVLTDVGIGATCGLGKFQKLEKLETE